MDYDSRTLKRIASKTDQQNPEACWPWQGSTKRGYGLIYYKGRNHTAHRILHMLTIGPVKGLHVDHLCANRWCVNPQHLEAVTRAENIRRGTSPIGLNAQKKYCKYGHTLIDAYKNKAGARLCRWCAKEKWRRYYQSHQIQEQARRKLRQ